MTLKRTASSLAVMLLLSLSASAIADSMKDRIKQELTEYNDAYNELFVNDDLEAFVALYSDAPLWIAPTTEPVKGLDVPRNTFQFIVDKEGDLVHTFDEFHVSEDGTQAVMIGQYKADIEAVGTHSTGTYLFVLERDEGLWKIVVDMFNEHKES